LLHLYVYAEIEFINNIRRKTGNCFLIYK
jgi:hypothetical protein